MVRVWLIFFILLVLGCDKTPTGKARKYIKEWNESDMYLPDEEQIIFFRTHLTEIKDELTLALSNPNPAVRQRAAYVIGEMGSPANILGPALAKQLDREPKRLVRLYIYIALLDVHYNESALLADLKSRFKSLGGNNVPASEHFHYAEADEKIHVASALYALDDSPNRKDYLEYILQWLQPPPDDLTTNLLDGFWNRRWCAVIALENIPEAKEAIPLLEAMLKEPNAESWVNVHVPRVLKVLK